MFEAALTPERFNACTEFARQAAIETGFEVVAIRHVPSLFPFWCVLLLSELMVSIVRKTTTRSVSETHMEEQLRIQPQEKKSKSQQTCT
jgi:hypothetical protein